MTQLTNTSPVTIFARLLDPNELDLTPEAAQSLLRIGFDQADHDRMHELAVKNQKGQLTPEEDAEFENYLLVGDLLAIVHATARACLKTVDAAS